LKLKKAKKLKKANVFGGNAEEEEWFKEAQEICRRMKRETRKIETKQKNEKMAERIEHLIQSYWDNPKEFFRRLNIKERDKYQEIIQVEKLNDKKEIVYDQSEEGVKNYIKEGWGNLWQSKVEEPETDWEGWSESKEWIKEVREQMRDFTDL